MKKDESLSFGIKLLLTLGKIAIFVMLFPYQVLINRKEGHYSVRSLAIRLASQRKYDEEGKKSHDVTFTMPGFSLGSLFRHKKKKNIKKEKRAENQ